MFVPTPEDISEISPYSNTDFAEHFGDLQKWIKFHTSKVYDMMYNAYKQKAGKQDHHRCIRLKIFMNKEGEQQAIIEAVHEILMGAITGEMDMEEYDTETGKRVIPESLKDKLDRAELLIDGKLFCEIPDGVEKYVWLDTQTNTRTPKGIA